MNNRPAAMPSCRILVSLATLLFSIGSLQAAGCDLPEHRQFDFWLGEWDVRNQLNRKPDAPTGMNRITSRDGGCVMLEEYTTSGGYSGTSISFYDKARGQWHQTWMDNMGAAIHQSGTLVNGSIVMTEERSDGVVNRTTWTPLPDGTVRQLWERSTDAAGTWTQVFDGIYTRRKK